MIYDEVKSEGFRRAIPMSDGINMDAITIDDAERMWLLGYDAKIYSGRVIDFDRAPTGRAGRVRRVSDGQLHMLGEKKEIKNRLFTPNELQDVADKLTTKEILTPNEMRALYGVGPLDGPDGPELKTYLNRSEPHVVLGRGSTKSRDKLMMQYELYKEFIARFGGHDESN